MHLAFLEVIIGCSDVLCVLRRRKNCSVLISVLTSRFILGPTKLTKAKHYTTFNNYTEGRQNRLPFGIGPRLKV